MRRREFVGLLGGAVACPLVSPAQSLTPVIGFLSGRSSQESGNVVAAFLNGLRETRFVQGDNVAIEFQWADGQYERLPEQARVLVQRDAAVIVAVGAVQAIRAAKAATVLIPIVFVTGDDPVRLGLVASLNQPGGNVTGVSPLSQQLGSKRLEILHELMPPAAPLAMLVNPNNPSYEIVARQMEAAARLLGRELHELRAATASEIDAAFVGFAQRGAGALMLPGDPFFDSRREQIVALAAGHRVPALYHNREIAAAGGLMSYGPSFEDSYHNAGVYAGRILKGEKPSLLPILQAIKFELVVNLKTAKALGLTIPAALLARADEVIE